MQISKIMTQREFKASGFRQQEELPPNSFPGRLRRFVQLEKERRELESRLKVVKDEEDVLKEQIGDELEVAKSQGLDSHARMDGLTIFLKYNTWARPRDGEMGRLCEALQSSGDDELEQLVRPTVDLHKLSAVTKDRLKQAAEEDQPDDVIFPPEVMEAVHISTTRQVQSRTGKSERVEE